MAEYSKNITIFASGSGTNAENIIRYFKESKLAEVVLIISDKPDAYVLKRAEKNNIPSTIINNNELQQSDRVVAALKKRKTDLIVLAGFMKLIPENLIKAFPHRIINIHPSLLPKYGGKGMYGDKVHQAVFDAGEKETGITIHFVNETYDEGEIIYQAKCKLTSEDTPETVKEKVHQLEYDHYPRIIEDVLKSLG